MNVEPDLLARIEQIVASAADDDRGDGPVVAAAITGLRADLGALRADLGALRSELGALRASVDSGTGRMTSSIGQTRVETETLARQQEELAERVAGLTTQFESVSRVLPGLAGDVREAVAEMPDRARGHLDEIVRAAIAELSGRVDTSTADIRRTISSGLAQASAGARAAENAIGESRSAVEERLAVLEDALDGLAERLEAVGRDAMSTTEDRIGAMQEQVRDNVQRMTALIEERSAAALEELRAAHTRTSEAVDEQADLVADLAETVRAAIGDLATAVDRSLGSLGTSLGDAASQTRADEREHLDAAVEQLRQVFATAIGDLRARVGASAESSSARLAEVRGFVETMQEVLEGRIESLHGVVASGMADAREEMLAELRPLLSSLEQANAASRRLVEDEVSALRTDLADALEEVRDRVSETTRDAGTAIRQSLEGHVEDIREATGSVRADVLDRVEELRAQLLTGFEDVAVDVTSLVRSGEETGQRLRVLEETVGGSELALGQLREEWSTRTNEVVAEARAASEAVVSEVRAEMAAALDEVRRALADNTREVGAATVGLSDGTERLAAAGRGLLGYLADRERALEAERDRVLHDVLDEFAEGLNAKERRWLSGRLSEALERRRDARDAQRWREAQPGQSTEVPPPPDLEVYAPSHPPAPSEDAADEPVLVPPRSLEEIAASRPGRTPRARDRGHADQPSVPEPAAEAAPAAETAPAKKAVPAKKAAAKKTVAKKATPAKKAVAKKAPPPAKKAAPAKKASPSAPSAESRRRRASVSRMPDVPSPDVALAAATSEAHVEAGQVEAGQIDAAADVAEPVASPAAEPLETGVDTAAAAAEDGAPVVEDTPEAELAATEEALGDGSESVVAAPEPEPAGEVAEADAAAATSADAVRSE